MYIYIMCVFECGKSSEMKNKQLYTKYICI